MFLDFVLPLQADKASTGLRAIVMHVPHLLPMAEARLGGTRSIQRIILARSGRRPWTEVSLQPRTCYMADKMAYMIASDDFRKCFLIRTHSLDAPWQST